MDYIFDIVLMKGVPWGFRMTGGKDFKSQLRVSMVCKHIVYGVVQ
jgi:hypothetical protein